ncbi:hypothetical protein V6N12_054351 [Hibiscus sabdariffa]|uniref:Uncharacterized protein n=1 Tax=Hibiscus sabdariffa TaxID=183260 RepID=A0ABR2D2W5_9ROSI
MELTICFADSMLVWNLLRQFHIRKLHVSVVLNEYGGTVGEEIQKTTGYIVMRAEGTFDVDVNTSIDKLSEDLSIKMQPNIMRLIVTLSNETETGFLHLQEMVINTSYIEDVVRFERINNEELLDATAVTLMISKIIKRRWSSDEGSNNVPQEEVKA